MATKHTTCFDTYGTQRIVLDDTINILFIDRRGCAVFHILPIEDSDIDGENLECDIFESTSSQKWILSRFCAQKDSVEINDHLEIDMASAASCFVDNIPETLYSNPTPITCNQHPTKEDTQDGGKKRHDLNVEADKMEGILQEDD